MDLKEIKEENRYLMGLSDLDLDSKVYRFITFETLVEMMLYKRLTFPKINCWDDSYENYLFKTQIFKNQIDISPSLQEVANRLFGQCWTLTPQSDALWRIYSIQEKGVRISTTLRKLYELTAYSESDNDRYMYWKSRL